MSAIALLLALAFTPAHDAADRFPIDEPITIELQSTDPVLDGHGSSHTLTYTPESGGTLYVWASAQSFRVLVRVEDDGGDLVSESRGGGRGERAPCVVLLDVEQQRGLRVTVAACEPGVYGTVELHLVAAPETEETLAAASEVDEAIDEAVALRADGEYRAARGVLDRAAGELHAVPGSGHSRAIAEARWRVGEAASAWGWGGTAAAAWSLAHAFRAACLPDDHARLLDVKEKLALALRNTRDPNGALALHGQVLAARARFLAPDHRDVLRAKSNVAGICYMTGDLPRAQDLLEEVLAGQIGGLDPESEELLETKVNLGVTRFYLGDAEGARILQDEVALVMTRAFPLDHPLLLRSQWFLALTRRRLGDLPGAHELLERLVAIRTELGDPEHRSLLTTKWQLGLTKKLLRDYAGALALQEEVHTIWTHTLDPGDPALLRYKWELASTRAEGGDLEGAEELHEEVLAIRSRTAQPWHPDVTRWRVDLAQLKYRQLDFEGAREALEKALEVWKDVLRPDDLAVLSAKAFLALTLQRLGREEAARTIVVDLLAGMQSRARKLCLDSPRFARANAYHFLEWLSVALFVNESLEPSVALGSEILQALENLRYATIASPGVALALGEDPQLVDQQQEIAKLKTRINDLTTRGPSEGQTVEKWRAQLLVLTSDRDRLERKLRAALGASGALVPSTEVRSIADALGADAVAISFLRFPRRLQQNPQAGRFTMEDELIAFLVPPDGRVEVVTLGLAQPIEDLIRSWRNAIGKPVDGSSVAYSAAPSQSAAELGVRIRERVLDPLLELAPGARTLHVVPDDFLYLLPFEALPLGTGIVGERYVLRTDPSLARLNQPPAGSSAEPSLLLVGGVDYDADPPSGSVPRLAMATPPALGRGVDPRSGMPWSGFSFLTGSVAEVTSIGNLFEDWSGHGPRELSGSEATKTALHTSVPGSRYLHVATHGWFAPEVFRSPGDPEEVNEEHREHMVRAAETVRGFAPETLCGLALSGANSGRDTIGRVPGILTAEELTSLDLRDCDLAVLSACDTNVGIRRAGLGVRSLQGALHAAGARTAITSLWKMDDAATGELMVEFYRNLWQKELGKADALWAAKMTLRERGFPESAWAGWVLTGDPD